MFYDGFLYGYSKLESCACIRAVDTDKLIAMYACLGGKYIRIVKSFLISAFFEVHSIFTGYGDLGTLFNLKFTFHNYPVNLHNRRCRFYFRNLCYCFFEELNRCLA